MAGGTDCDDNDASIYPGAVDTPGDGVDQDCDGADSSTDTGEAPDSGSSGDTGASSPADSADGKSSGCACSASSSARSQGWPALMATLGALVLTRRRCLVPGRLKGEG